MLTTRTWGISAAILAISLAGCGDKNSTKPVRMTSLTQFRYETHILNPDEHIVVVDVPDFIGATRCMIFVSTKTNTSNMTCDLGTPLHMPPDGAPPDNQRY
jgi:predicted small lipoprotein YifL